MINKSRSKQRVTTEDLNNAWWEDLIRNLHHLERGVGEIAW